LLESLTEDKPVLSSGELGSKGEFPRGIFFLSFSEITGIRESNKFAELGERE
jgi:hypothetical protein